MNQGMNIAQGVVGACFVVVKRRIYMCCYGNAKAARELKKWNDDNCGKPFIIFVEYKDQVMDVNFGIIRSFDHYVAMAKEANTMDIKNVVEAKFNVPVKEQHYIRGYAAKFGDSTLYQEEIDVGTTYVLVDKATWIMYALPVMILLPLRIAWTLFNIINSIIEFECDVYDMQTQLRKLFDILKTIVGLYHFIGSTHAFENGFIAIGLADITFPISPSYTAIYNASRRTAEANGAGVVGTVVVGAGVVGAGGATYGARAAAAAKGKRKTYSCPKLIATFACLTIALALSAIILPFVPTAMGTATEADYKACGNEAFKYDRFSELAWTCENATANNRRNLDTWNSTFYNQQSNDQQSKTNKNEKKIQSIQKEKKSKLGQRRLINPRLRRYLGSCPYENDGACDVPEFCDSGTDDNDCSGSSGSTYYKKKNPCVCKTSWNGIGAYSHCRNQCGCTSCDSESTTWCKVTDSSCDESGMEFIVEDEYGREISKTESFDFAIDCRNFASTKSTSGCKSSGSTTSTKSGSTSSTSSTSSSSGDSTSSSSSTPRSGSSTSTSDQYDDFGICIDKKCCGLSQGDVCLYSDYYDTRQRRMHHPLVYGSLFIVILGPLAIVGNLPILLGSISKLKNAQAPDKCASCAFYSSWLCGVIAPFVLICMLDTKLSVSDEACNKLYNGTDLDFFDGCSVNCEFVQMSEALTDCNHFTRYNTIVILIYTFFSTSIISSIIFSIGYFKREPAPINASLVQVMPTSYAEPVVPNLPIEGKTDQADQDDQDDIKYFGSIPAKTLRKPKNVFKRFDTDNDKCLDATEVRNALSYLDCAMEETEFDAFFEKCDKNRDGTLSYKEFKKSLYLRLVYENLDTDSNGSLDVEEVRDSFEIIIDVTLNDEEFTNIYSSLDRNADGSVSFKEFKKYFKGNRYILFKVRSL